MAGFECFKHLRKKLSLQEQADGMMFSAHGITENLKLEPKIDSSFLYIQMEVFSNFTKQIFEDFSYANSPWKSGYREMSQEI